MEDHRLIEELKKIKEDNGYTLYDLSKKMDIQISTLSRWFKTNRINRVYAQLIRDKLNIK